MMVSTANLGRSRSHLNLQQGCEMLDTWPSCRCISMSPACALTSCRQRQSGLVLAIRASTPLLVAERIPLGLRLVSQNMQFDR